MAMTSGPKGGLSAEMNVTPMIDVLLVLLVIFMLIAPSTTGLHAAVPQPQPPDAPPQPETPIVLQLIQAEGGRPNLKINEHPQTWDSLQQQLADIYKLRSKRALFIRGDAGISFSFVAEVIDTAHSAGIDEVGLMTPAMEAKQR